MADEREGKKKSDSDRERREKRIRRLKQKAERIEKFLAENQPKHGRQGKEMRATHGENRFRKIYHKSQRTDKKQTG